MFQRLRIDLIESLYGLGIPPHSQKGSSQPGQVLRKDIVVRSIRFRTLLLDQLTQNRYRAFVITKLLICLQIHMHLR